MAQEGYRSKLKAAWLFQQRTNLSVAFPTNPNQRPGTATRARALILHQFHGQQDPGMSRRHKIIGVVGVIAIILVLVLMYLPVFADLGVGDGQ